MFQKLIVRAVLMAGLLAASAVQAQDASCPVHYVGGRAPQITNPRLAQQTRPLCFNVFGVMHSGVTRTPLWSAEHLRADNVEAAQDLSRENSFHAEPRLPPAQRAELADYARSGFDRGHMAPNGDMPDRSSQRDSFSLANIVPQDGENNRYVWAAIEGAVRKMAKTEGDLYVITGPAFLGTNLRQVGKVLVPSHLYNVIPITELERIIGINLLPALAERDKERMLRLPKIRANGGKRKRD
jgi:endonuclease G